MSCAISGSGFQIQVRNSYLNNEPALAVAHFAGSCTTQKGGTKTFDSCPTLPY